MTYYVDNILDLLKKYDNETISKLLGQFVCHKNEEIDTFIRKKALPFAKQGLSITYLVCWRNSENMTRQEHESQCRAS